MIDALKKLFAAGPVRSPTPRITIVVAHPGDEIIGAGAQLHRWTQADVMFITDGAPADFAEARDSGFSTPEDYALARQRESIAALAVTGIRLSQIHLLEFPERGISFHLLELAELLAEKFVETQPEFIITHGYEGIHPDFDSTAFAVDTARQLLRRETGLDPGIVELGSYHFSAGHPAASRFLSAADGWVATLLLSEEERAFKERQLACFKTQQKALESADREAEHFRSELTYNFLQPARPGELPYERWESGIRGDQWRQLAREALQKIGESLIEQPRIPTLS